MKKQAYYAGVALLGSIVVAEGRLPALADSSAQARQTVSVAGKASQDKLQSALFRAAEQDDLAEVRALLKQHAGVDGTLGDGTTALHWAAYNDDVPMAKLLLASGAAVDAPTRARSLTPLHIAAESGDAALIEALLKAGAKVNAVNDAGTTPLMIAAASGSIAAVSVLLAHGAEVNAKEKSYGQTALFFAADRDRADVVRLLMSKGADPKVKTTIRKLARITVGVNGEVLDEKKNATAGEKKDGAQLDGKEEAASAKAAEESNAVNEKKEKAAPDAKATTVLTAGDDAKPAAEKKLAPPDDKVKDAYGFTAADRKKRVYGTQQIGGMTALLLAARNGHRSAVEALLDAGDDINQSTDTDHSTALILALINGHYDLAHFLLERGADAKLVSGDGVGPLFALIDVQWAPHTWYPQPVTANEHISYLELAKELLKHGANPNAAITKRLWFRSFANDETWFDVEGSTPFLRAALAGDLAAMQLLVDNGANPNLATKSEDTPLMAAAGIGWAAYWTANAPTSRLDAVKYCIDHGAKVNAKDVKGYTALHGAAFRGDNEMIHYLIASGADIHAKTKDGDTVADVANGLFEHAIPHAETVALLEGLGSANSHHCRSNECVVAPNEDKAVTAKTKSDANGTTDTKLVSATLEAKPK